MTVDVFTKVLCQILDVNHVSVLTLCQARRLTSGWDTTGINRLLWGEANHKLKLCWLAKFDVTKSSPEKFTYKPVSWAVPSSVDR